MRSRLAYVNESLKCSRLSKSRQAFGDQRRRKTKSRLATYIRVQIQLHRRNPPSPSAYVLPMQGMRSWFGVTFLDTPARWRLPGGCTKNLFDRMEAVLEAGATGVARMQRSSGLISSSGIGLRMNNNGERKRRLAPTTLSPIKTRRLGAACRIEK